MEKSIKAQLGMSHKANALKQKLHKTSHSSEYCRHCGMKTRSTTTHESGHREYDHERIEEMRSTNPAKKI